MRHRLPCHLACSALAVALLAAPAMAAATTAAAAQAAAAAPAVPVGAPPGNPAAVDHPLAALPHTPSLDPHAMDRKADPCVDFYQYSCGGWMQNNPIPPDRSSWSVYAKLAQDNQSFLWGMLQEAAKPTPGRTPDQQKIGDFFAACMDESAVEARGTTPIAADLQAIAGLSSVTGLPALLGRLHGGLYGGDMLFTFTSGQDYGDASQVIGQAYASGLGLPDRDYYVADDDRSREARVRYVQHVAAMLQLLGEPSPQALADAHAVMSIETSLAAASLTRVERRDPKKIYHRMTVAELQKLMPTFHWESYLAARQVPTATPVNVTQPAFFQTLDVLLHNKGLDDWRAYLRWHLVNSAAPYLSAKLVSEDFAFNSQYMQGTKQQPPRWKRCVRLVDRNLGEALGRVYVEKTFTPEEKQAADSMVKEIEQVMADHIRQLDWMSPATRQAALGKLAGMRNKIGYPAHWRDYSAMTVRPDDLFADVTAAAAFNNARELAKIGRPVDREEWGMTPPTVNAYYDPSMNDINFPAGVLQPPLYDPASDDAPNYGDTGGTVGHELTHGFDDEGSQFDAQGNLRNWWTPSDRSEFEKRAACVSDQYAKYIVVDDIHLQSKLTLGEDLADLGGTILAYEAWKRHTASEKLQPIDGLTPDQRFFVGYAQWACSNDRPETLRLMARTNPHSPAIARVNGIMVNIPEFARAFSCKPGQPMAKDPAQICRVW